MDVARDGPRNAKALLVVSSACHGVEGFCGSGVQVALLEDADWHRAAPDAGVAVLYVHGLNPWGFSWWRRTTHENVDLNRNFRDFSGRGAAQRRLRRDRFADRARDLAAGCGDGRRHRPLRRRARRQGVAGSDIGRPVPPSARPLLRRRRADLEPDDAAPGAARPRNALQQARLDRPAHRPRTERPWRAHLRLSRRCRRLCPGQGLVGRRRRRSTTARRPRPCSPA